MHLGNRPLKKAVYKWYKRFEEHTENIGDNKHSGRSRRRRRQVAFW